MHRNELRIENERHGDTTVLRLTGEIGVADCGPFDMAVTGVIARKPMLVVLDFSKMTFISSLGMGSLVRLCKALRNHSGKVKLAGTTREITMALTRAKLDELFEFHPTVESALA